MLNYGKKRAQKAELQILSIGCYVHAEHLLGRNPIRSLLATNLQLEP